MATASSFSVRAILEQMRQYSKADMVRRVEESDMKIKSLEKQLAALMELRDHERALSAALKYLLSPIYTLPAELLAEIFKHAVDEETHLVDVFRVSQVCLDWREVAHNTPRLWTGVLPIPIALVLRSTDIRDGLLEEVMKTASRWRSLELDFRDHRLPLICRLAQCRLDRLEELDLGQNLSVERLGGVVPSFLAVPRLRKLRMSISSSVPIFVPWRNLTDLTLHHCPSPDSALDVIAQCAGLVKLFVRTVGWSVLPHARQHNLGLHCLHTLSFALCQDAEYFTPFFSNLSAPVLQELCLSFWDMSRVERWTEAHFTAFQLQAPNITRLELQFADLATDDFLTAILHAPSLTHLKLFRCDCFDDAAMTAMHHKDGVTALLPRLHHLVLECMEHVVTDDILAGMIASRWWTDAALASRSDPPAVARWTHVELWFDFSGHILLQDMPSDILMTSTRGHPKTNHFF
ncbi:hypothetical protein C8R45DRAFT_1173086 [Mycena sanguinolenta]|nr:hypothetical protein C8R45DRAFT_1173086 [Mycena sanguinolenta]